MNDPQLQTVVIGGSQAGLAVGYHLMQRRVPFVILDENDRVGDAWRKRWDSLRLFTPGRYDGLPGMPFPGSRFSYPTKGEAADYLETYVREFNRPVRTGVKVARLSKTGARFAVVCDHYPLLAKNVVVATGAYNNPRVPPFARELDESIVQLHSKEYRNPSQIREGGVLVVGAGNSGAEIAIELARDHQTWLSGRDTGQEPTRAGSLPDQLVTPIIWFMATRVLRGISSPRRRKDAHSLERHLVHRIHTEFMTGSISRYQSTTACQFTIAASSRPVPVSTSWGFPFSTP
jgi:putative flavoprotein involved in K+ transport